MARSGLWLIASLAMVPGCLRPTTGCSSLSHRFALMGRRHARRKRNPFLYVEGRLSSVLFSDLTRTHLRPLWSHVTLDQPLSVQQGFANTVLAITLKVLAQVHWRLSLGFSCWPYPLLSLVDPTTSERDKSALAQKVFDEKRCCLDPHCTRKVRDLLLGPTELLEDTELMSTLRSWSMKGRVCNMHVERIFARVRQSTPQTSPNIERVCAAGFLKELSLAHVKAGGTLPGVVFRSDLLAENTPIQAVRGEALGKPAMARGHITYMTHKLDEARGGMPRNKLPQAEQAAVRKAAMAEWRAMSPESAKVWVDRARDQAAVPDTPADEVIEPATFYDSDVLWGISSFSSPLSPSVLEEVVCDVSGKVIILLCVLAGLLLGGVSY